MNQFFSNNKELKEKKNCRKFFLKIFLGLIFSFLIVFSPGILLAKESDRIIVFEEARQWQIASDAPVPASITLYPDSAGDHTGLEYAGNNWQVVSDESDSTYVSNTGKDATKYDLYGLDSPPDLYQAPIEKVTVNIRARQVEKTGSQAKTVIKTGGTEYRGTATNLGSTFATISTEYTNNPNTSATWTWSVINSLQGGGEIINANTANIEAVMSQVWIVVDYLIESPGPPGTPTYSNIAFSTLTIGWTASTSTEGGKPDYYQLERAPDSSGSPGSFSFVATTTNLFHNDSGRSPNTIYWYRVMAINVAGSSNYSTSSSVLTLPDKPGTPTYTNISTSTLTVNWATSTGGADYYELERAPDVDGSSGSFSFVATTTDNFYNDSGLSLDTTYWYKVRAVNQTGEGEYSDESDVTTLDAPPGTPDPPTYSNITASSLRVNWDIPPLGGQPDYYELERADDDNGSPDTFSFVATTTELYYDDSGLEGGSVYWYRVKAINVLGESDFSAASSVSTAFATILKGNIRIKGGTTIR